MGWPIEWRNPSDLDVETSKGVGSFVVHKRNEATKKVVRTLANQKNKEVIEKAHVEQERAAKEQVE